MSVSKQFSNGSKTDFQSLALPLSNSISIPNSHIISVAKELYSPKAGKMRMDIPLKNAVLHFSRTPCEQEAKIILELLRSPKKPEVLKHFNLPLAVLSSKREDMYSPFSRSYIVSASPKNHIPLKKTKMSKYRIKIIGKLISILASLHSVGILAGDTTTDNIALKNNYHPVFRSAGQIHAMSEMGEGISEFLYLLCDLMRIGAIVSDELLHLIRHYLATNKEAYLHAKYYLHSQNSSHKKIDEGLHEHLLSYYSRYFC